MYLEKVVWEHGYLQNPPEEHQQLGVLFLFHVDHDGRQKTRLAADRHLTKESVETVYSGVVSLRTLHLFMFLGELNQLEL